MRLVVRSVLAADNSVSLRRNVKSDYAIFSQDQNVNQYLRIKNQRFSSHADTNSSEDLPYCLGILFMNIKDVRTYCKKDDYSFTIGNL